MTLSRKIIQHIRGESLIMDANNIKPNFTQLGKKLGVSRHTARKYYYQSLNPDQQEQRTRGSKYDVYYEEIKERAETTTASVSALYHFFRAKDPELFTSYSGFKAYIRRLDLMPKGISTKPSPRFETEPGYQLQVDWKESLKFELTTGEVIEFELLALTWGYSRYHQFIYSKTKTNEDFMRGIITALIQVGGKPKTILTDNMSSICNHHTKKLLQPIAQFAKDLDIDIRRCKIRQCQTKGKVESPNRFIQWLSAYKGLIKTEDELIKVIKTIETQCNDEPNGTTRIKPSLLLKKEMEQLDPLPRSEVMYANITNYTTRKVPNTLLVRYETSDYSVPREFIGKSVQLASNNDSLYIYHNMEIITVHELNKPHTTNYKEEHYKDALTILCPKTSKEDNFDSFVNQNLGNINQINELEEIINSENKED